MEKAFELLCINIDNLNKEKPLIMVQEPFPFRVNIKCLDSLITQEILLTHRLLSTFKMINTKFSTYVCLDELDKPMRYKDVVHRKMRESVLFLVQNDNVHFTLDYQQIHKIREFDLWVLAHRSVSDLSLTMAGQEISTSIREEVISILHDASRCCLGGMVLQLILEYENDLNQNPGQVIVQSGVNQEWHQLLLPSLTERFENLGSASDEANLVLTNVFRCMFVGFDGTRGLFSNDWSTMESEDQWERTRSSLLSKKILMMPSLGEMVESSDDLKLEEGLVCWKYFSPTNPVTSEQQTEIGTNKTRYFRLRSQNAFAKLLDDCQRLQCVVETIDGSSFVRYPRVFQRVGDVSWMEGILCTVQKVVEVVFGELLLEVSSQGKVLGMKYRCQPLFGSVKVLSRSGFM
eukprot:TRINITY_DN5377_c0_g1_i2.p1 TRINITY_DN5377_c0_g1~~TRINITY_DN5377_c0_g1_i2.p1  ORF type:complete len:419 (+),score=94.71 TRINITY_DN5377_c0_g1_i2:47-1258(+)